MVISRDFMKSGKTFSKSVQLMEELQIFLEGINAFLQHIDPTQFFCLKEAREKAESKYPYIKMVDKVDLLLMEGRAIMWNRMTPDPAAAVTLMYYILITYRWANVLYSISCRPAKTRPCIRFR